MNLPYECGHVITRALAAGVALDDGNVIDLLADNLPSFRLPELRAALAASSYAGRWPSAERGPEALNLDNSPAARRERFAVILAGQFEQPAYALAASKNGGPRAYAEKYVAGLTVGSAEHTGAAVQATCRALGIGKTLKALKAFLIEERRP